MTTNLETSTPVAARSAAMSVAALILGWLVPGAGHILLGKYIRGVLLFVSVTCMFWIGITLQGKIYTPNTGDLLDILGFVGDLGAGILYILARTFDWGHATVQIAVADYGTKFIVVAGLLNIISAVDAHSLANGRKLS
jgi:TM2 domain-containing membrane protein YozV